MGLFDFLLFGALIKAAMTVVMTGGMMMATWMAARIMMTANVMTITIMATVVTAIVTVMISLISNFNTTSL